MAHTLSLSKSTVYVFIYIYIYIIHSYTSSIQCHHHFWKNPDHIVGHSSDINMMLCFYKPYFLWFRTGRQVIPAMWRKNGGRPRSWRPYKWSSGKTSGVRGPKGWTLGKRIFIPDNWGNWRYYDGIPKFQIFLGEIERPCQGNYSNYSLDEMQNLILGKT